MRSSVEQLLARCCTTDSKAGGWSARAESRRANNRRTVGAQSSGEEQALLHASMVLGGT